MRALYDSKSKTILDRGLKELLTKEESYRTWLQVEIALAQAQASVGLIPKEAAEEIAEKGKIENLDFDLMAEIYEKIGHGFVPFLKVMVKACGEESGKYIHYGITTQNVQQTSQILIMKKAHTIFMSLISEILDNLSKLAADNADAVMAGRTHGKHAIPITYGYKVAVWISELITTVERLQEMEKRVFTVMMGGAVGAFNSVGEIGIEIQNRVAEILDLQPMLIPSRNINGHKIEYINNLCLLASTFHKMAEEVFQTSIEEFSEVSEGFLEGTVGSSTMPHKINPKLSKGIIANSQKLYSLSSLGHYSAVRPYEGDSTSYMLFDGLLDEAMELMIEIILRAEELSRTLTVNKERLYQNANINKGLDNSEYIMMKIAEKLGKDKAHEVIYSVAMDSELNHKDYFDVLKGNDLISLSFSDEELKLMLDPKNYIGLSSEIALDFSERAKQLAIQLREQYA